MNNIAKTDIDIDTKNRDDILNLIKHIPASIKSNTETKKHNTGVYVTDVPINPFIDASNIDYKEAEDRGYFKLDILNVGVYENVKDERHLVELVTKEPDWSLLEHKEIVEQLFHIHNHFDIVNTLKPKSVEQLAAVLAVIRPAKRHLAKKNWNEISNDVWQKPTDGTYFFKKSHAVGYAMAIVLQLNLLSEQAKTE
jgi:predicted DNA-binding protein (MmcQ/YjbR family)